MSDKLAAVILGRAHHAFTRLWLAPGLTPWSIYRSCNLLV